MSHVDLKVLNELRSVIGQKYLTIQQTYLGDTEARLREIARNLTEGGDMARIVLNAHAIRSASSYVGGMHLANLAFLMEMKAQEDDHASVAAIFKKMLISYAATRQALKEAVA